MAIPADQTPYTSPIAAGIRLITTPRRARLAWLTRPIAATARTIAAWIRAALLIVAGLAALVYAVFQLNPTAGWAATGLALLVLDWCRRDTADRRGSP